MSRKTATSGASFFFCALIVLTVLKAIYMTRIPLTSDEAYFWVWSRHLAFGYYDHPPAIAWMIAFFTRIGGHSLFWTRLAALACLTGTIYLTYLLGREIGGRRIGAGAGLFGLAAAAMTLLSILVSTDSPLILFWMWTVYLVWRAVQTHRPLYWYGAGLTLGLGLLSKFIILPLIASVFLFLLLSRRDRFWLKRREPYLALGLAFLIFIPFLIWNSQNGWLTLAFNATRHRLAPSLARPLTLYFGLQALALSPVLYAGMLWSFYRLARRVMGPDGQGTSGERRVSLFILLNGWLLPALFLVQSVWQLTSAHWTIAAYGTVFVGLALAFDQRGKERHPGRERRIIAPWTLATAFAWTAVIVIVTLSPDLLPVKSISGHNVSEAYGWEELGRKVSQMHRETGKGNLIATDSYATSSMISYYTPDHLYLSVLGPGSINGRNYDLWDHWPEWVGRNVLLLSEHPVTASSKGARILGETCERFETLAPIELHHRGRVIRRFYPAMGYHLKPDPFAALRRGYRW